MAIGSVVRHCTLRRIDARSHLLVCFPWDFIQKTNFLMSAFYTKYINLIRKFNIMTKVTQEMYEQTMAEHGAAVGEHKDKSIKIFVSKDKKSQSKESVGNVFVITNDVKQRKYAISLTATVISKEVGKPITDEDPYLAELQDKFCEFLSLLRADVE